MNSLIKGTLATIVLTAGTFFSTLLIAMDKNSESEFNNALALYQQREIQDQNGQYSNILKAIEILTKAETTADTNELKYDIAILKSRCHYWIGQHHNEKSVKLERFQNAMSEANAAKKISDEYAEGYYYYGVALSRWAEANGVMASLGKKDELMKTMKESQVRITRDEKGGETIDGQGPDRVLGRIYFKLPGIAGGSRSESLKHLSIAYNQDPKFFLNGIFYAETLASGGSDSEKTQACDILKLISSKKAEEGHSDRIPENQEDISEAQILLNKICK